MSNFYALEPYEPVVGVDAYGRNVPGRSRPHVRVAIGAVESGLIFDQACERKGLSRAQGLTLAGHATASGERTLQQALRQEVVGIAAEAIWSDFLQIGFRVEHGTFRRPEGDVGGWQVKGVDGEAGKLIWRPTKDRECDWFALVCVGVQDDLSVSCAWLRGFAHGEERRKYPLEQLTPGKGDQSHNFPICDLRCDWSAVTARTL